MALLAYSCRGIGETDPRKKCKAKISYQTTFKLFLRGYSFFLIFTLFKQKQASINFHNS